MAELPNVPTQAQMDACKKDCDAIGDEFEQAMKLKYVTFTGFVNAKRTHVQLYDVNLQASQREVAMNRTMGVAQARRPPMFIIGYSDPLRVAHGQQTTIRGQVVFCDVRLYISHDAIRSGPTNLSTVVAYPALNAYLNAGNIIPPTAQIP